MPTLEATAHALDSGAFHSARKLPIPCNISKKRTSASEQDQELQGTPKRTIRVAPSFVRYLPKSPRQAHARTRLAKDIM